MMKQFWRNLSKFMLYMSIAMQYEANLYMSNSKKRIK